VWLVYKKNILSILVLFFLFSIFLVSNFLIDVGATMAERFLFHASVGFTALLSFGFAKITSTISLQRKRMMCGVLFTCLTGLCCIETVARNAQWKDDFTLFTHDVHIADNSFLVNGNAGSLLLDYAEKQGDTSQIVPITRSALVYLHKAVQINYRYSNGYLNLGLAYAVLDIPDSAKACADFAKYLNSEQPFLKTEYHLIAVRYYNRGIAAGKAGNRKLAAGDINKALQIDPSDAFAWYNLGKYYSKWHERDSAKYCWLKALSVQPNYKEAKFDLDSLNSHPDNAH
jgi:tetratricopeptide (TPR) repeat protein